MRSKSVLFWIAVIVTASFYFLVLPHRSLWGQPGGERRAGHRETQGSLCALNAAGSALGWCPLVHTEVNAEISGILSRVTVRQDFRNSFTVPIEAVYAFPLPHDAAVDDMAIHVGARTIRSVIKRREEAAAVYQQARAQGKLAALLDQERPNIFTQQVANILPGQNVEITISYVATLKYENGGYSFVFPMVVGPRYIPGMPIGKEGGGWSPDTHKVPDASKITPPVVPPGMRAGHDISMSVTIEAGIPFGNLRSPQHEVVVSRRDSHSALVRLADKAAIPNKDFILTYDVAGASIGDGLVTHRVAGDGYFMLILQPPQRVAPEQVVPKEVVFLLDTSGSMQGFPIEKAKETMSRVLGGLYAHDCFNLITFSGDTRILFPGPVPATEANLARAQAFLSMSHGSGGTEMMRAIRAALLPSDEQNHVRIVCFMTDGQVGNDMDIIAEVQKHPNARIFAFGIGSSTNRFLLDRIAEEGRGAVEYVTLADDADAAARRFHERIRNPLLTDIHLEWGGVPVTEIYPRQIPDLFSTAPVVVCGRYGRSGRALLRLSARAGAGEYVRELAIPLPDNEPQHDVLATLWARKRIDALMAQDFAGMQNGRPRDDIREAIIELGLQHRLMTQFTSFVAVENRVVTEGGKPVTVQVPVDMPEGVSYAGVFGTRGASAPLGTGWVAGGMIGGMMGGTPGGVVGGVVGGVAPQQRVTADPTKFVAPTLIPKGIPPPVDEPPVVGVSGVSGGVLGGMPPPPPPPPHAKKVEPMRVGGNVQESKLIRRVEPIYPELAHRARVEATVILEVHVDEQGNVGSVRVVRGHPLLDEAAVQAVKQWKYSPTVLNGMPVPVIATAAVIFKVGGKPRLDPAVAEAIARFRAGQSPAPMEQRFIKDGKAQIKLTVTNDNTQSRAAIRALGFEAVSWPQGATTMLGRLAIDKLEALLDLNFVVYLEFAR
jgi:Ca-activated chloride channel family protein